jgi:hypothetical protein
MKNSGTRPAAKEQPGADGRGNNLLMHPQARIGCVKQEGLDTLPGKTPGS